MHLLLYYVAEIAFANGTHDEGRMHMSGKAHDSWPACQMHYHIKNNSTEQVEKHAVKNI